MYVDCPYKVLSGLIRVNWVLQEGIVTGMRLTESHLQACGQGVVQFPDNSSSSPGLWAGAVVSDNHQTTGLCLGALSYNGKYFKIKIKTGLSVGGGGEMVNGCLCTQVLLQCLCYSMC